MNGSFPPSTWVMFLHDGETTNNRSEGYNARLNSSSYLSDRPNVFLFAKSIIEELKTSANNAVMAQAGNANTRGPNTKKMRSAGIRKKLQLQLEEGTIDLISLQQAVGGCILTQEVTKEMNCDDLPFDISGGGREDVAIRVPELCEIVAPVPDALALELETVESLSSRTPAPRVYRHVNVSQKRKSEVSSSVAGANLRRKRRRVVAEHSEVEYSAMEDIAVNLDMEDIAQHFIGEVKRKEYFEYFDKPEKLTLKQGHFVMNRRLIELGLTVSPSQKDTPQDGNCLFHSLLDQVRYNPELHDFAEDHLEFRYKVVNYGYDLFLKTRKLVWSNDPALGTPREWKTMMMEPGEFGDEAALTLASNVLGVDIVIVPAFRESSVHQGFGITIIKSLEKPRHEPLFLFLFSESDFTTPHYQSVRPTNEDNVLSTFLEANNDARPSIVSSSSILEVTEGNINEIPVVVDESQWSTLQMTNQSYQQIVVMSGSSER